MILVICLSVYLFYQTLFLGAAMQKIGGGVPAKAAEPASPPQPGKAIMISIMFVVWLSPVAIATYKLFMQLPTQK